MEQRDPYWRLMVLVAVLAGLLALGLIVLNPELWLTRGARFLGFSVQSPFAADYSADPKGQRMQAMQAWFLQDVLNDAGGGLPTDWFLTPVPTATGQAAATPTLLVWTVTPDGMTATVSQTAPVLVTLTLPVLRTPTRTPTGFLPSHTNSPFITPTRTQAASATPLLPTITQPSFPTPTSGYLPSQTNTPLPPPTNTPSSPPTPTSGYPPPPTPTSGYPPPSTPEATATRAYP